MAGGLSSARAASILCMILLMGLTNAQFPVPARYDGFTYGQEKQPNEPLILEGFFDLLCGTCRDAWPAVRESAQKYGPERLRLIIHPFPNAFHQNAYFAARGMHVVSEKNASLAFDWMESVFKNQEAFSLTSTALKTPADVLESFGELARKIGVRKDEFLGGMKDPKTDLAARISFKFGCSRMVTRTPTFLLNGVPVAADDSWTIEQWEALLGPLSGRPSIEDPTGFYRI